VDGLTLRVGSISEGTDAQLTDVFVERCDDDGVCTVITAAHGTVFRADDDRLLKLRVFDGRSVVQQPDGTIDGVLMFAQQDVPIDLPRFVAFRARGEREEEATFGELLAFIGGAVEPSTPEYNQFRGEFHYRLLHTLTFLTIPLMALPFGLTDQRKTSNAGPVVGIPVLVIYNEFLEAGQRQVSLGESSPWLSMWPAFIVFSIAGAILFYRVAERPGRRRLKVIEWLWGGLSSVIGRVRHRLAGTPAGTTP